MVLVLSVLLAASRLGRLRQGGGKGHGWSILLEVAVWAAVATAMLWAIEAIGFLVAAPVLIAAAMLVAGSRNLVLIAILSVAFPVIVDQAAWYIFTVDLP